MSQEQENAPQPPALVTSEQFAGCVLDAPIAEINQIDSFTLSQAYQQAAATTPPCKEVYTLLSSLAGIHLSPEDRGRLWGPIYSSSEGRSMIPSDVKGEQSDILDENLPRFQHPAMRARVADIVWTNDLRKKDAAAVAMASYCECVEGLLSGSLKSAFPIGSRDLLDAQKPMHRALQIASATTKKGTPLPDRVRDCLLALYDGAKKDAQPVIFSRIAQLAFDYKIRDANSVAGDLEVVAAAAETANPKFNPDAVRSTLDFAGHLYNRAGDKDSALRCEMGAVRQMLRMRDECAQFSAKASWVTDALLRLRHIKSDEAQKLEAELEDELKRLQKSSLREMAPFEVNIEVPGERERISDMFSKMDFATALKTFALIDGSPKMEDLKTRAKERARHSPLMSMMSAKHVDSEGRIIVNTSGAHHGEPPEDWYTRMIAQDESLRRAFTVANHLDPARQAIMASVAIEERHFGPIVYQSGFVPRTQAPIYALGFARLFQGDGLSATHLIVPQLEPSLRHILKMWGDDPSKRRDDSTEEDLSLDAIITHHRETLEKILGAPLVDEINRIFNLQPGPTLRHSAAHGQLSASECYGPDAFYACWLLYRICCLFVIAQWDEWVRPGLEIEEPGR